MPATLCKPLYKPLSPSETSPFDAVPLAEGSGIAFRVQDRHGSRFERPLLVRAVSRKVDWLWPGKIPRGRVTLIEGPAGAGKSMVALDLAARLSSGRAWPDGTLQSSPEAKAVIC